MNPGKYVAKAVEAVPSKTGTGKDQIAVKFRLVDSGDTISWYGYFTDGTIKRTLESLRHCGFKGYDLGVLDGTQEATERELPNEVELDIQHEEYQGKTQTKVKWVNAAGGASFVRDRMDAAARADFAGRMKGALLALEANGGSHVEDVPFS